MAEDAAHAETGKRRRTGGVILWAVLVLTAATGLLIGGVVTELNAARRNAVDSARTSAVLLGERLLDLPELDVTPGDTSEQRIRTLLDEFAPRGGAAHLVDGTGRVMAAGGTDGPVPLDAAVLEGAPVPGFRVAIRALSDDAIVVTSAPAVPSVGVFFPYIGLSVLLLLGAMVMIRRIQAITDDADEIRQERDEALHYRALVTASGLGTWKVQSGTVTLPGTLRRSLGFADKDVTLPLDETPSLFAEDDRDRADRLLRGKSDIAEMRLRMFDAAGDPRHVFFSRHASAHPIAGVAIPMGAAAAPDGRTEALIARLHETLEAIPQAFLHWNASGRLVTWNGHFCDLFRVDPQLLRHGMSLTELAGAVGIAERFLRHHFAPPRLSSTDEEAIFPDERCMRIIRKRTTGGGWVCIGHDITDTKTEAEARARKERELQMTVHILEQSRRELSELNERYAIERQRAEDANRAKTEFLANVSHELRTPLNAINGFSAIMQSELYGPLGSDKYVEYVNDINDSGRHLLELINEILDLSKIEAGKMELRLNSIDLEKVLEEAIRVIEPQSRGAQIQLHAAFDHLPTVFGDPRAVKQVVLNLLTNAAKFTEAGGRITVTTVSDLESVTVIVADTGVGIEADNLRRLGTPFISFGSAQERDKRGTGLGLALSKSLIEAMDGILCMASEKGRGTVAAFTLPRRHGTRVQLPDILEGKVHVLTRRERDPADMAREGGSALAAE